MRPAVYEALDAVADSFDPLLALLALAAPLFRKPRALRRAIAYYLCGGAAVAMVYVIRAVDGRYGLWHAAGLDYSTHTAFAATVATSLGWFHRRWAGAVTAAVALYLGLVLVMRYHGILDVVSSSLLAAATAAALHFAADRGLGAATQPHEPIA